MAIEAQGTKIFWSATTALSTAVQVNGVIGFNGPSGSAGIIDVTDLGSTAKEKLMGLPDEGQLTFDINYLSTDAGQQALRDDRQSRAKKKVAIKLTDDSTELMSADAFCTGFSLTGAVDDAIKGSITLELTGPIAYTTA